MAGHTSGTVNCNESISSMSITMTTPHRVLDDEEVTSRVVLKGADGNKVVVVLNEDGDVALHGCAQLPWQRPYMHAYRVLGVEVVDVLR